MLRSLTLGVLAALALVAPCAALDLQHTKEPGRVPGTGAFGRPMTDGELTLNRADKSLFFKNLDGTVGVGSLLKATTAGRRAVELGQGDDLTVRGAALPSALDAKAPLANPTFSGAATVPKLVITGTDSVGDVSSTSVRAPGAPEGLPLSTWLSTPHFAAMASPLNTNAYDSYNPDGTPMMSGWAGAVVRSSDSSKVGGKERYGTWFVYDGAGTGYPDVIASTFAVGISNLKKNWWNTTIPGQTISLHLVARCGYHGALKATAPAEFGGYYPGGDCSNLIANAVQSSEYASLSSAEMVSHYAEGGRFDASGNVHSINTQIGAIKMKNPDGSRGNTGIGLALAGAAGDLGYAIQIGNTARPGSYSIRPGKWEGAFRYNFDDGGTRAPFDAFRVDQDGSIFMSSGYATNPSKKSRVGAGGDYEVLSHAGRVISALSDDGGLFLGSQDISWTEAWQPGFSHRGQGGASRLTVVSDVGRYAISSATRASDNKTLDQINIITDNAMCVNDNAVRDHRVWCRYEHGIITPNAKSQGHINDENSVANFGPAIASDPYNLNPHGQSSALRLDSGVGDGVDYPIPGQGTATVNTVSAAATIMSNGAKFFAGLQIGAGTFDTSLTGGIGHAVQMPIDAALTWQHQAGFANVDWRLYASGTASAAGPMLLEGAGQVRVGPKVGGKVALQGGAAPSVTTTAGDLTLSSATGNVVVPGRLVTPAWAGYVPAAAVDANSTAVVTATGQYELAGKTLRLAVQGSVSFGGGVRGNAIMISLPPGLTVLGSCNGTGRENSISGKAVTAFGFEGQGALQVLDYNNLSIVENGATFAISATCQVH